MSDMIRLENVVKITEGSRVLSGVNLVVAEGECVTISGPPGSGKSALARLIAGIDKPSAGEAWVLETPLHTLNADAAAALRNRYIGMLKRNPSFVDSLTVLENVAMPLVLRGEASARARGKAREQLKTAGLQYAAQAYPPQLRPVEKHKAAVARMLTQHPKLVLLDDFAAGFAAEAELVGMLRAVCRFGGYTVVELTGGAQGLVDANRTLRIEQGRIQEDMI